ncbi:MAG: hypothetical protein JSU86_01810 [Phycisphaerales bacterium]|nr:MAG: hypothetical protein JSU86_01810 [Phycisphaerales bacterium]
MPWRLVEFIRWVASGGCIIRDIHGQLIPLRFNLVQRLILSLMLQQALAGLPIRVVILKARKTGVTTVIQSLLVRLCQVCRNQIAKTIAHKTDATREIFEIARRIVREDPVEPQEPKRTVLDEFGTGSTYACFTAGGAGVGAGGTPSALHLSEVGLWPGVMTAEAAEETEYTATKAVPTAPETIIIYESTGRARNLMWDRFQAARTGKSRYKALFVAWYLDARNTAPVPRGFRRLADEIELVDYARRVDGVEISNGMLQWRRDEIMELGLPLFKQEFPSTPEEAVEHQRGLVVVGLHACVIDELPVRYDVLLSAARIGGADFGYVDPTVILTAVEHSGIVYVIGFYRASRALADEHAKYVRRGHRYYGDPAATQAGQELVREARLRNCPITVVPAPRAGMDSVEDEWRHLNWLIRQGRLKILRSVADQLLLEADNLSYNATTGRPDDKRGALWGHFDSLDALRYLALGVYSRLHFQTTTVQGKVEPPKREPSRRERLRSW